MTTHDKSFEERNSRGSLAENHCRYFMNKENWEWFRLGFDMIDSKVPKEIFWKIPKILRSLPDFIVVGSNKEPFPFMLEVKGGKDVINFKKVDFVSYCDLSNKLKICIYFYFYFSTFNKAKLVRIDLLDKMIKYDDVKSGVIGQRNKPVWILEYDKL